MKKKKYGFVYIWYDRKHSRYYIGCHWGQENDDYICSSTWMRNAYKRRPADFKRRILCTNVVSKQTLLEEEYKWLKLIKDEELGIRYYNLSNTFQAHWTSDEEKVKTIGQKISLANKGKWTWNKGRPHSEETKRKLSESHKGLPSPRKGKKATPEQIEKNRLAHLGRPAWNKGIKKTDAEKAWLSQINKGKIISEETRQKLRLRRQQRREKSICSVQQ